MFHKNFDFQLIDVQDFNGVGESEPNPYFYQVNTLSFAGLHSKDRIPLYLPTGITEWFHFFVFRWPAKFFL